MLRPCGWQAQGCELEAAGRGWQLEHGMFKAGELGASGSRQEGPRLAGWRLRARGCSVEAGGFEAVSSRLRTLGCGLKDAGSKLVGWVNH